MFVLICLCECRTMSRVSCHCSCVPRAVCVVGCLLQLSPHRVEVAVLCWPVTLDRDANYWTVLYALQVGVLAHSNAHAQLASVTQQLLQRQQNSSSQPQAHRCVTTC